MPMNIVLVIAAVFMVGLIFLLNSRFFEQKDKRRRYLESLAELLEAKLEPVPGAENSFQIRFLFKNREFVFEDVEDRLQDTAIYRVSLKAKTASNLKVSFTERPRTTIRANVQSFNDLKSPWTAGADKVILPVDLQGFMLFSNDTKKAIALFANEAVVKIFLSFMSMAKRGHPAMSLEIVDGIVTLSFHPAGELKPTWVDLQNNPSRIEDYLDPLHVIAQAVDAMNEKEK